ncbi:MAG: DNA polymerase III subunit gamma/tau [Bacillota bacterium]
MRHLALYRKFRPLTFDEVIGQDSVVDTIKNQIKNNNFGHAYLFTGIRGTGKTTIAKIFARSVNCQSKDTTEPCNECEICKSFLQNSSMDIIEMDAASNNGVDDVREIKENVKFPPSKGKYKVYIIDEVHMLSKGAFNALLKTLEEPPEYVLFLLATTEPNKIPETILSRCQRYDLKRVSFEKISNRLEEILDKIDIEYDIKALNLIVSKSEGSVRDALSILEKCISTHEKLTSSLVANILGLVPKKILNDFTQAIIDDDLSLAIDLINSINDEGKDLKQFIDIIINHFRNLMIIKIHKNSKNLLDISNDEIKSLKSFDEKLELIEINRIIQLFVDLNNKIKWATHTKVLFEVTIIKIFKKEYDLSKESIISQINKLSDKIEKIEIQGVKNFDKEKSTNKKDKNKKTNSKNQNKKLKSNDEISSYIDKSSKSNISIKKVLDKWQEVLQILKKVRIKVYAFLVEGKPINVNGNKIILYYNKEYKFHGDNILKNQNKETIENVLKKVYMTNLTIDVTYKKERKTDIKNNKKKSKSNKKIILDYFNDYSNKLDIK